MSELKRLDLESFRNLSRVELDLGTGVNLFVGGNASGKTSLMEAVFSLGRARSFRSSRFSELIQRGAEQARVVGVVVGEAGEHVLGLEIGRRERRIRINRVDCSSLASLSRILPLQLIHPGSHALLEGGPKARRAFMDWGVFHVEPGFQEAWQRYRRVIQHRNTLLRKGGGVCRPQDLAPWDVQLAEADEQLHQARNRVMARLQSRLRVLIGDLFSSHEVTIVYRRGWDRDKFPGLTDVLENTRAQDLKLGYTRSGAHRADLRFLLNGTPVQECLSRGEQKLLIAAAVIAQNGVVASSMGHAPLLLVDDFSSELDCANRKHFLDLLVGGKDDGGQVLVTSIELDRSLLDAFEPSGVSVFHVEPSGIQRTG